MATQSSPLMTLDRFLKERLDRTRVREALTMAGQELYGAGEAVVRAPYDLYRGIIAQGRSAVLPGFVEEALPEAIRAPAGGIEGFQPGKRVGRALDALLLNIPSSFGEQYKQQTARNPNVGLGDFTYNTYRAGSNLLRDVLTPLPEAKTVLTGRVHTGVDPDTGEELYRDVEPGELGAAVVTGVFKWLPIGAIFSRLNAAKAVARLGTNPFATSAKTATRREINTGVPLEDAFARITGESATPGGAIVGPEQPPTISIADARTVFTQATKTELLSELYKDLRKIKPGEARPQTTDLLAQAIEQGAVDDLIPQLSLKYNLTPPEITNTLTGLTRRSGTFSGQMQQVLSAVEATMRGQMVQRALTGDVEALAGLRAMRDLDRINMVIGENKGWVHRLAAVEDVRRAFPLMRPGVTLRNIEAFTAIRSIGSVTERIVARSYGLGPEARTPLPGKLHYDYWGRATEVLQAGGPEAASLLAEFFPETSSRTGRFAQADRLLAELPLTTDRLMNQMAFDVSGGLVQNWFDRFRPRTYGGVNAKWATSAMTSHNWLADVEARKWTFTAVLDRHAQRLGYGDLNNVESILRTAERVPDDLRYAIADAETTALKETFGYGYTEGLGGAIIKLANQFRPWSTILTPTMYPRFLANSYEMMMDYNPAQLSYIFNKGFRKELFDGARDNWKGYEARRTFARATTGVGVLGAALFIRNSAWAGDRPWEIRMPEELGGGIHSMRGFPVWKEAMLMAEAISAVSRGDDPRRVMTANEWADLIAGAGSVEELAIFDFEDWLRSLENFSPESAENIAGRSVTNYLSPFFVPADFIRQMEGGLRRYSVQQAQLPGGPAVPYLQFEGGINSELVQRDIRNSPWGGKIARTFPSFGGLTEDFLSGISGVGAGLDPDEVPNALLPYRFNHLTGEPEVTDYPLAREFGGSVRADIRGPFESYVRSLPGSVFTETAPNYDDPRANQQISQLMGKMLNAPLDPSGTTLAQRIMENVPRLIDEASGDPISHDRQAYWVQRVLQSIREPAIETVRKAHPDWFLSESVDALQVEPAQKRLIERVLGDYFRQAERAARGQ